VGFHAIDLCQDPFPELGPEPSVLFSKPGLGVRRLCAAGADTIIPNEREGKTYLICGKLFTSFYMKIEQWLVRTIGRRGWH
jgi:hypothetical protein